MMDTQRNNATLSFKSKSHFNNCSYRLLPFSFTQHNKEQYLISNDSGEYCLIPKVMLRHIIDGKIDSTDSDLYNTLKGKHFITDSIDDATLDRLATKVRTKKAFLYDFTSLHIFVATLRCDHTCVYCQVSRKNVAAHSKYDMPFEVADKAIDCVFRSPSKSIKIEFQGGEPLLNFKLIKRVVQKCVERNRSEQRDLQFIIATNLSTITDAQLKFCKLYNIYISTSLDGPPQLHNAQRKLPGRGSYSTFVDNLARTRAALGNDKVSALMTTTTRSFEQPKEIIDEYLKLGFRSIFLRSISPYGFATRSRRFSKYEPDTFLKFYKQAFEYILDINRKGTTLVENFAQIILEKLLTPFPTHFVDLQSPSGAGIASVVYNYDGLVYLADEARMLAEMGDKHFSIGDVGADSYENIFGNPTLLETCRASIAECLPGCADCAYRPFCGGDPVYHYAVQGDEYGHRPSSGFCKKNMGVIRYLLDLLESGDQQLLDIFYAWINRQDVEVPGNAGGK